MDKKQKCKIDVVSDGIVASYVLDILGKKQEDDRKRTGVHVSDLIFPRKAWYSLKYPQTPTDEECLYFMIGRAHHGIMESLIATEQFREVEVKWNGITGTIDCLVGSDGLVPVECKTTRSATMYNVNTLPMHYLRQLGMYVAMLRPDDKEGYGTLLILYLSIRDREADGRWHFAPLLQSYTVHFRNLDAIRGSMIFRKAMLEAPIPPPLDTCEAWLCRSCRYYSRGRKNSEYCEGHR